MRSRSVRSGGPAASARRRSCTTTASWISSCAWPRTGRPEPATRRSPLARETGAAAFLPATDDDVVDARVWLAWAELWRSNQALEVVLDECRQEERALLAKITDYRFSRQGLDTLTALIDGLTTAVCAPHDPMPPARARKLLAGWMSAQAAE